MNKFLRTTLSVVGATLLLSAVASAGKPVKKKWKGEFKPQILQTVVLKNGKSARPFSRSEGRRKDIENMYGGWARYDVYDDFNDIFGFDITDPKQPYDLSTSDILLNGNHEICAAAWDGSKVHFVSEIYYPDYDRYMTGFRGTLDPLTGEMTLFGKTGYASAATGNLNAMTFDPVGRKLYGVALNGVLYNVSMTDTTSAVIDTIRWKGQKVNGYPMTLSASPSGSLFAIFNDGFLYKINKNTAEATVVGTVDGETVQLAYQSATFDRVSGELYWARIGSESIDLYKVDTLTGHADFYSQFGLQTTGLFHQYYEDMCDVYPGPIEDLEVKTDGLKVSFSWTNPTVNGLGEEVDCFSKIYVYRAVGMGDWKITDSILPVPAGQKASYAYTEKQEGYYRYGFQVVNAKGIASGTRTTAIGLYNYSLPYATGFEETDNNTPVNADERVQFVKTSDMVYEGSVSAFIPTYSRLRIAGLPFEKGTTYRLTFVARGYELGLEGYGELNKPFTVKPFATLNVRVNDNEKVYYPAETQSLTWATATVDLYTDVTKSCEIAFSTSIFDEYYLDNVRIETLTPNTVPAKVSEPYAEHSGTALSVDLHWKNPVKTAGDEDLQDLKGIIVQASTNNRFDAEDVAITDTVKTTGIGAEMQKTYTLSKEGYWYFRFVAFNKDGRSPMDTSISGSWIGRDTVMDHPVGLTARNLDNGKIRLSWNKMQDQGTHGGDLDGTITGYRIVRMDGNGESRQEDVTADTVFETEPLPMNFYTFSVNAIRNGVYDGPQTSIRLIGGLYGGQTVITDIASDAGFSTHPFNVCTEFSNQSTVNQFIVSKGSFKEPCIIDTLYFMMSPLSLGFTQKIKIHLGTYRKDLFVDYGDWMAIDSLTEVFAGSLRFEKGANILKVPVKPFYYDGKQNLLVSVIKGQQTARLDVRFISNPVYEYYPQIHDYHLETMSDYYDLTGKPIMQKGLALNPIFLVNCTQNLNTVKGRVTAGGEALAGALVEIAKTETSSGMDFAQTLYSDAEGYFSFTYFPDNTYRIRVSYAGMQDFEKEVELHGGQTEELQVELIGARKVRLTGTVVNRMKQGVPAAKVSLAGVEGAVALTGADGSFVLEDIYGTTRYTVHVTHDIYQDYQTQIRVGEDAENRMDTVHLVYYPFPVSQVWAQESDGKVVLSWEKPLQSIATVERKYHGARKSSICSSAEITAAIRFPKDSLRRWVDARPDLTVNSVAFQTNDTTAHFTIRLFTKDWNKPAYEQEVGYLPSEAHRIFLDSAFKVDTAHDMLVAVRVADGYKGCPLTNDAGPQLNDGSMIEQGDGWGHMSDYMHGADGSNWILSAFFGHVQTADAPGYRIYRTRQEVGPCRWEAMASTDADTRTYTDETFGGLPFGDYRYAVRADWFDDNLSREKATPVLSKDMYFKLTLKIEDPASVLPEGAEIVLKSLDGLDIYEQALPASSQLVYENIRRNTYRISVKGNYPCRFSPEQFSVSEDAGITVKVETVGNQEALDAAVSVYPNPSADGRFTVSCDRADTRYEVFAVEGRLLLSGMLDTNSQLDLSAHGSGVYVLRIISPEGTSIRKLIVGR
ncbi:MAG: carboxypeptidase regulatory-like domain-containing protein [Bacteroides sp.]|nr:carboxypeptidase regulatory-like domain-containing protein [Bacteroides sp.]MCM1086326.1 carboxypeptidase regulatory-like domain-containing protein [Bacteroides sp.]